MKTNLDKYREDLKRLLDVAELMLVDLELEKRTREGKKIEKTTHTPGTIFLSKYQKWYSESYQVIKQLLPDRLDEFERLYKPENKRKTIDSITYTIQDWLRGVRSSVDYLGKINFEDFGITVMRFNMQVEILKSAEARFESSLFDIKQVLQADLFDSELDAARELLKNGFQRGSGAIAGVVLEKHLEQVCLNHKIAITKKYPSIGDLNDLLKNNNVFDVSQWRFIQRLGDLRNLCDHNKKREPTPEEVSELIEGTEKILKTIF
jgi:hypothetical protein